MRGSNERCARARVLTHCRVHNNMRARMARPFVFVHGIHGAALRCHHVSWQTDLVSQSKTVESAQPPDPFPEGGVWARNTKLSLNKSRTSIDMVL